MGHSFQDEKAIEVSNSYARDVSAGHDDWVVEAERYDAMYRGDQWDAKDKERLRCEGRPALTLNLIKPAINAIGGEQRAARAEFTFKPRNSEADSDVADIITKLGLHIQDSNEYDFSESLVFDDGMIMDRGWFDIRMEFEDNLQGEIKITTDDPLTVIPDPDAKSYDPDDWNRVHEVYWLTLDEVAGRYGRDVAKKLQGLISRWGETGSPYQWDAIKFSANRFGDTSLTEVRDQDADGSGDRYIRAVRVIERQRRETTMGRVFVDLRTGDIKDIPEDMEEEEIQKMLELGGLATTKMMRKRIRWTVVAADSVTLHDDWSPYPFFTKVPFFPWFRRGKPMGLVRDLISAQEQLNKTESQELHIINTTANSGWIIQDGSLVGMTYEDLEQHGSETGLILRYSKNFDAPQKIKPNQVPTGLDRKSTKTVGYMREMSVNRSFLGQDSDEVSGVVMREKKQSALTVLRSAYDNLNYTRKLVAKRVLWMIQRFYTEERIIRVTDYSKAGRPDIYLEVNKVDEFGRVLNDVTLGEYDVIVSARPARDTQDESDRVAMLEMRDAGIPIPADEIILRSNLSNKTELAARVAQLDGTAEPSEEEQEAARAAAELDMARAQAEVAKLQGQVEELRSKIQLNLAKAEETLRGDQDVSGIEAEKLRLERDRLHTEYEIAMGKLRTQMQQAALESQTKLAIADRQVGVKEEQMRHDSVLKRLQTSALRDKEQHNGQQGSGNTNRE